MSASDKKISPPPPAPQLQPISLTHTFHTYSVSSHEAQYQLAQACRQHATLCNTKQHHTTPHSNNSPPHLSYHIPTPSHTIPNKRREEKKRKRGGGGGGEGEK